LPFSFQAFPKWRGKWHICYWKRYRYWYPIQNTSPTRITSAARWQTLYGKWHRLPTMDRPHCKW